jgi:predicted dehydrogenase
MKHKVIRIGLLGFGNAARWLHFPVLRRLRGVELVGVADSSDSKRAEVAKLAPELLICEDFPGLITSGLDALVICTPNALHAPNAIEALSAGLDVYLEKPMAVSLPEAEQLAEVFRNSNRIGMLGLNYRFGEMQQAACEAVQSGRLGKVVAIRGLFSARQHELPAWKKHREQGGGALLDLAVHHMDLACWMMRSTPTSVVCRIHSQTTEDDTVFLEAEFPGGIGAQFLASLSAGENDVFEIYGTEGCARIDRYRTDRCEFRPTGLERVRFDPFYHAARAFFSPAYWWKKLAGRQREGSYHRALEVFVDACRSRRPVHPDFSDGLRLARILDAAERSSTTGSRIPVPQGGWP